MTDSRASAVREDRLKDLFRDMVDIYSPSGKEEEIVAYLADYLKERGLPVLLHEVTEDRFNIEVVFSDSDPDVAFIGHVDTVHAYDIEEYAFAEENGLVCGLGTADMKGGCAAMIEAFVALAEADKVPGNTALFLVVGEEETGDGTASVLERRKFPWAIVAEPTDLIPCLVHYGYTEMLVRAFGTRRHASMAGRDYNAIYSMLGMLLRVADLMESNYPEAVMNIRDLHSSQSGFAVPDRCAAWVDIHAPPAIEPEVLATELKAVVDESLAGEAVTGYEVEFPTLAKGYNFDDAGLLPDALRNTYVKHGRDWLPGAFKSHSDANLLREAGCQPLILGPGQLAKAHTRDESIDFRQVVAAAELYHDLLLALA